MFDTEYGNFANLADYFKEHPEDEQDYQDYVDELAEEYAPDEILDFPEDWKVGA